MVCPSIYWGNWTVVTLPNKIWCHVSIFRLFALKRKHCPYLLPFGAGNLHVRSTSEKSQAKFAVGTASSSHWVKCSPSLPPPLFSRSFDNERARPRAEECSPLVKSFHLRLWVGYERSRTQAITSSLETEFVTSHAHYWYGRSPKLVGLWFLVLSPDLLCQYRQISESFLRLFVHRF